MTRVIIKYDNGDGYIERVYCVKDNDGNVGTYHIKFRADGTVYGAERNLHKAGALGTVGNEWGIYNNRCEFTGGACRFDGTNLAPILHTETERWAEAACVLP